MSGFDTKDERYTFNKKTRLLKTVNIIAWRNERYCYHKLVADLKLVRQKQNDHNRAGGQKTRSVGGSSGPDPTRQRRNAALPWEPADDNKQDPATSPEQRGEA
ncbi:hypothetical protein [Frankia sp. CiP3]|uniref:hypothetical protein n=1 Tax=Frankia sp. CiP3 TaxID=2880971 RepID=UPI001EF3F1AF|nr:hypothetical protein [Frankia sp. CiP3]